MLIEEYVFEKETPILSRSIDQMLEDWQKREGEKKSKEKGMVEISDGGYDFVNNRTIPPQIICFHCRRELPANGRCGCWGEELEHGDGAA